MAKLSQYCFKIVKKVALFKISYKLVEGNGRVFLDTEGVNLILAVLVGNAQVSGPFLDRPLESSDKFATDGAA